MRKLLKNIFSIDTTSTNRTIVTICGIKIRHLRKDIWQSGQKYMKMDCPAWEIPPATGSLRKIQLADLKLGQIFDKMCKENGINYWIDFGNLLGAVRHKGFIPWDDDFDVGMMREDYEKLIETCKDGFPGRDDLYLKFDNNGKDKCFVKILHKTLPYLQIDVFPYDFYYRETKPEERIDLTNEIIKLRYKPIYKLLYPFFVNNHEAMRKRLKRIRDQKILKNQPMKTDENSTVFYAIDYPQKFENHFFDQKMLFPISTIKFEGVEFPCPADPVAVLKQAFGETYMEVPDNCYPRHVNSSQFSPELDAAMDKWINE